MASTADEQAIPKLIDYIIADEKQPTVISRVSPQDIEAARNTVTTRDPITRNFKRVKTDRICRQNYYGDCGNILG